MKNYRKQCSCHSAIAITPECVKFNTHKKRKNEHEWIVVPVVSFPIISFGGCFILPFSRGEKKWNKMYCVGTLLKNNKIVELCECVGVWIFFCEPHSWYYLCSHCWNVRLFHFSPCQPYRRSKVISTAHGETVFRWFCFPFFFYMYLWYLIWCVCAGSDYASVHLNDKKKNKKENRTNAHIIWNKVTEFPNFFIRFRDSVCIGFI